MATAGKILIMPKGAWDAEKTYEQLDAVSHNNRAWLAKKTSVGIEPSRANSEYWHDMLGIETVDKEAFDEAFAGTSTAVTYENSAIGTLTSYVSLAEKRLSGNVNVTPTEESLLKVAQIGSAHKPDCIVPFMAFDLARSAYANGYIDADGAVYVLITGEAVGVANTYNICVHY